MTTRYFLARRETPIGQFCLLAMGAHEELHQAYQAAGRKVAEAYGLPHLEAFKFQVDKHGRPDNIIIYKTIMHPEALRKLHPDLMPVKGLSVPALRYPAKSDKAKGLRKLVGKLEQYENFQTYLLMKLAESVGQPMTHQFYRGLIGTIPTPDGHLLVTIDERWKAHAALLEQVGFEELPEAEGEKLKDDMMAIGAAPLVEQAKAHAEVAKRDAEQLITAQGGT